MRCFFLISVGFAEKGGYTCKMVIIELGDVVSAFECCGSEDVVFVDIDAMLCADIGESDFISGEIHGF